MRVWPYAPAFNTTSSALRRAAWLAALLATLQWGCASNTPQRADDNPPDHVRMTWFGISNWHYQIGNLGILLDGAVSYRSDYSGKQASNPALVSKVQDALTKRGSIDVMLLGHKHDDHSLDSPAWALNTGAKYYAPAEGCADAIARGVPAAQCTVVKGGETIALNRYVTMRVVKWNHSITSGCTPSRNRDFETIAFLFTVQTRSKLLTFFVSDSGAGPELMKDRIEHGVNHGSPFGNLFKAVRAARLQDFELWQGGPETRLVTQARLVVPAFLPKFVMPHHMGARGGYDLTRGLHYRYESGPQLVELLGHYGAVQLAPVNYFDAWVYDASGVRADPNPVVKTSFGLPAQGPGPGPQGVNPRQAEMECAGD